MTRTLVATVIRSQRASGMISDQTADRIRALLNDEQRKKYNPVRLRDPQGTPRPDVTALMGALTPPLQAPVADTADH